MDVSIILQVGLAFLSFSSDNTFRRTHADVAKVLTDLRVWQEAAIPGGLPGWSLNGTFKKNIKIALLGG